MFFLLIFLCFLNTHAQQYNLVPNSSFEQYNFCPIDNSPYTGYNSKPDFWYKPDTRGAIYANACANGFSNNFTGMPVNFGGGGYSYQQAKTGNGYLEMYYYNGMDSRNYIQVKLKDSLRQGMCYYAEYYVSLFNTFRVGCNNQSMLFTNNPIYVDTNAQPPIYMLPANPQITNYANPVITDTLNWIKVSGVFTAQGGEQYLTLGNFKNNAQTATQQIQTSGYNGAAYYLDDVSVIPLDSLPLKADAGRDTTIAQGSSVYIGSYTNGLNGVSWFNSSGAVIATGVPGLSVSPTSSTFYVIQQTVCGYTSKDTVYVNVGVVPLKIIDYTLRQAQGDKVLNTWITANETNVSHFNIQRSSNGTNFYTLQKTAAKNNTYNEYSFIDMQPLAGTSYYRLECVDTDGKIMYSKVLFITLHVLPYTLSLYPNPASSLVNLVYNKMKQILITDITGRVIKNIQLETINNIQVVVSGLTKGIYLVKAIGGNGISETKKLVIQ